MNQAPDCELRVPCNGYVIALNGSNACVILDGSGSSDLGGDPLTYVWLADLDGDMAKEPIATGVVVTHCFDLGIYDVMLVVDDGRATSGCSQTVTVVSPCEAVEECITLVNNSTIDRKNKRPLIATLKAACAAFERGDSVTGVDQLKAFQNKVRAQIAPKNPSEAAAFIACAQKILDAIECAATE